MPGKSDSVQFQGQVNNLERIEPSDINTSNIDRYLGDVNFSNLSNQIININTNPDAPNHVEAVPTPAPASRLSSKDENKDYLNDALMRNSNTNLPHLSPE